MKWDFVNVTFSVGTTVAAVIYWILYLPVMGTDLTASTSYNKSYSEFKSYTLISLT
jgi:hypothetical protein